MLLTVSATSYEMQNALAQINALQTDAQATSLVFKCWLASSLLRIKYHLSWFTSHISGKVTFCQLLLSKGVMLTTETYTTTPMTFSINSTYGNMKTLYFP